MPEVVEHGAPDPELGVSFQLNAAVWTNLSMASISPRMPVLINPPLRWRRKAGRKALSDILHEGSILLDELVLVGCVSLVEMAVSPRANGRAGG